MYYYRLVAMTGIYKKTNWNIDAKEMQVLNLDNTGLSLCGVNCDAAPLMLAMLAFTPLINDGKRHNVRRINILLLANIWPASS